jgi:carboxyl-terminal processing protease
MRPNPSLKLSPNGVAHWACGAGASPQFCAAVPARHTIGATLALTLGLRIHSMRPFPLLALLLAALLVGIPASGRCQAATPVQDSPEDPKVLAAAVSILREGLVRPLDEAIVGSRSVAELIQKADPDFGEYLTKQELEELGRGRGSQANRYGVSFRRQKGETIAVPRAHGPAALAGLVVGDRVEKLEGRDVQQMKLWELQEILSSTPDRVTLTVRRSNSIELLVLTAAATSDALRGVEVERPAPNVLLLRPPPLSDATLKECVDALAAHLRSQDISGIILDLRGNPGGSLNSVVGHASMFLHGNSLVAVLRSNASIPNNMRLHATPEFYLRRGAADPLTNLPSAAKTMPLAVLIDESTSAGAELLAAAIQSHKRGVVVGRQSGGIASIQTFSMLPNGTAIKYTSAYWETSTGMQVNDIGLRPDRVVAATDPKAAITAALEILASSRGQSTN